MINDRIYKFGAKVFELIANQKAPLEKGYQEKASTTQIDGNYGILMGIKNNAGQYLVVIDIDIKNGKNGFEALKELPPLPETLEVETPSGGRHLIFWTNRSLPTRRDSKGIDFQGHGSYIVGAGSVVDGIEYEVINDRDISQLPDGFWPATRKVDIGNFKGNVDKGIYFADDEERLLEIPELQILLSRIDPNCGYEDWRNTIWNVLFLYGSNESTYKGLLAWSIGIARRGFDLSAFHDVFNGFNAEKVNDELDPISRLVAIQNIYPRYEGWLPLLSKEDEIKRDAIASDVSESVVQFIKSNGSSPNLEHQRAIYFISQLLASQAFNMDKPMKLAVPLFTGGGKTVCVCAFLAYMVKHLQGAGAWVAVGTIDQIDEIELLLKSFGVKESDIGIKHSRGDKRLTDEEAQLKPIVLCTHERIKQKLYGGLGTYQGNKRIMVWDEALIATSVDHITINKIADEIGKLQSAYMKNEMVRDMTVFEENTKIYLESFVRTIKNAGHLEQVELPEKHFPLALGLYNSDVLRQLDEPLSRIAMTDKMKNIFWWKVDVPDELDSVLILDASARFRRLQSLDPSIQVVPVKASKDYSPVTLKYCISHIGRNSLKGNTSRFHEVCKEIVHIAKHLVPEGENLLVFHILDREEEMPLLEGLRIFAGNEENLINKIILHSWGKAKGLNSLKHIHYATHFGMIVRDPSELAVAASGQRRDQRWDVPDGLLNDVQLGEHTDMVLQAIGRMACRSTINGKAGAECTFWQFYPNDSLLDELKKALPGINVQQYTPVYLARKWSVAMIASTVVEYLIHVDGSRISMSSIRKQLGIKLPPTSRGWKDLKRRLGNSLLEIGWRLDGRSIIRLRGRV